MNIVFSGPFGDFGIGCTHALLFRDNVQHHLQGGLPGPGYPLIHAFADAPISGEVVRLGADAFWEEVSHGFESIRGIGIDDLAVSIRTRAVLTNKRAPIVRGTVLARLTSWRLPVVTTGALTLGDFFVELLENVKLLTRSGTARGAIYVAARDESVPLPFTVGRSQTARRR